MTFGSLFAGVGGFDLGFERAGMVCKWQVEIDELCRSVLGKHWPDVARHDDVATFPPDSTEKWRVDVICGGFPCQDISLAGKGVGIGGSRSGLWVEFARIVRLLRPRFVVVENVGQLLHRGLSVVLQDLARMGYDAEWVVLPATAVGALHLRPRLFIVAYPERDGRDRVHERQQTGRVEAHAGVGREDGPDRTPASYPPLVFGDVAEGCADARLTVGLGQWGVEPQVDRVVDGVPRGVVRPQRIALGNAVVPQMAELIGRKLMADALESGR